MSAARPETGATDALDLEQIASELRRLGWAVTVYERFPNDLRPGFLNATTDNEDNVNYSLRLDDDRTGSINTESGGGYLKSIQFSDQILRTFDILTSYTVRICPPGTVIALAEHVTDAADREAIGRVVHMFHARANLMAVKQKNARRGASQEACDEVNRAGFAWQAAWEAITEADLARLERLGSGGEGTK